MSFMQPQFIIVISMLTLGQCLTSKLVDQEDDRVIFIDQDGTSDIECCMYGKCHCSNLSLALEYIQENTEIRIQSDISLHNTVLFGNVSNVTITGDGNPTVRCDHQGGLLAKNITYIVIQGITWDSCNGITMLNFMDVHIIKCGFFNFTYSLTLHGIRSVNINGCLFFHNNGSIDALATSVTIRDSKFYGDSKNSALVINATNASGLNDVNVTIKWCGFSDISKHYVHCIGSVGLMPKLSILYSNFTNSSNTAVNVEHCNMILNNVTFYNNSNVNCGYINDGGAIRIFNGTVNMTGSVLVHYNRAGSNGGAIYLNYSVIFVSHGSILFYSNTAGNGGAIYISEGSMFYASTKTMLGFIGNHATSNGGAVYVDLHHIKDAIVSHQLGTHHYDLLTSTNCTCDFSNTADIGSCVYFIIKLLNVLSPNVYFPHYDLIASSTPCYSYSLYGYSTVNIIDIDYSQDILKFHLHDLHLAVTIMDCNYIPMGPVNASFICCHNDTNYSCIIDSKNNNFTVTSKNNIVECFSSDVITCEVFVTSNLTISNINVIVQRIGHGCDDIAHAYYKGVCLPICPAFTNPNQANNCAPQNILPGYWYDNGFSQFVTSCPIGHCNQESLYLQLQYNYLMFPDRNLQCNNNWRGFACGECNYSANYSIEYDTTKCINKDECLTSVMTYNLLILFGVSFFYWVFIIFFISVLLHFKFDITVGYAYGVLFYYGVLEQLVNDVTEHLTNDLKYSYFPSVVSFDEFGDDDYEYIRLNILPFLSSIGNLKPPFTGFMKLCFKDAEMIDHIFLGYIHPLIVTFLVVIIFILARNSVLVAQTTGRCVNSKSICILLLLSYNSITYTSMKLLKPLPVLNNNLNDLQTSVIAVQVYWSPTVKYFHDRHLWYGIIAILCELIIGLGLPLVLICQRYLIRYSNINFMSIKHIIDQLIGCYKEEYRWFAAYYLICRQVLYGVNILVDYCEGFLDSNAVFAVPFPKFTIMLIICIFIMMIHVSLHPYKKKSLNILDTFILLALVGLLVSALEISWNRMSSVVIWFLPLLILINYLAYSTKLKYLIIPCSSAVVFGTTYYFVGYLGIFSILFLASSAITLIAYIIYVLKCLYTRFRKTRHRYVAINEQDDEVDENDDT